ncbi:hypothetical protein LHV56_12410 [Peribacillus frigoritolerans]|uniref:hypothetical protein n=1 Tax=Peribacillus frigoritolerans TaxID=450367 RepID=UPI00207A7E7D|nr:hypothetical protein [Peribacillus frigoritolerans]USK82624.1 hypothetical protein LHV56_12410 [Peribacillus frigoritolerans]
MNIPDIRFRNGYEKLIEMRNLLITKMDLKQLQEFTKVLYEDLDYYRKMADFHSSIGLTDDARRVRRLEIEVKKINDFLSEFTFFSLGEDGSIITNRHLTIGDIESISNSKLFSSLSNKEIINSNQHKTEDKLDGLINEVDNLTKKATKAQPSIAQQIMLGLLINLISSLIMPSSSGENHTYILNNNVENSYTEVQVSSSEQNVFLCNNLTIRDEPSNNGQILIQVHGMLIINFISEEREWVLIEFKESGNLVRGWVEKRSIFPSEKH